MQNVKKLIIHKLKNYCHELNGNSKNWTRNGSNLGIPMFSEGDEYTIIKISKAAKSGTNRLVVLAKWVRQEWYTTYKNFPK